AHRNSVAFPISRIDPRSNTRWLPRLLSHARSHSPSSDDCGDCVACVVDIDAFASSPPPPIDTVPTGGPAITLTTLPPPPFPPPPPPLPFPFAACPPPPPHPKSSIFCPCPLTKPPASIINPVTTIHITEPLLSYERDPVIPTLCVFLFLPS